MGFWQRTVFWLKARLVEGSTWAGIAAASEVVGSSYPPLFPYCKAITVGAAAMAVLLRGGAGEHKLTGQV